MQLAVKKLEEPLKQLVRFDPRFFTDAGHPARACWMRSRSAVWRSLPKMRRALPSLCAW